MRASTRRTVSRAAVRVAVAGLAAAALAACGSSGAKTTAAAPPQAMVFIDLVNAVPADARMPQSLRAAGDGVAARESSPALT